jgi:hypothetical protein
LPQGRVSMSAPADPHLTLIRPVSPQTPGECAECVQLRSSWVHLRFCLTCGHVGCCDSSPRADYFEQMSIYYAASQAEALLCQGDLVAIVGGGNSAGQAAIFLARYAAQVTLIVREHDLSEYMSRYLIDQLGRLANVRVLLGTEVRELLGDEALAAVVVEDNRTGARQTLQARALFVFIGVTPCTGWLSGLVDLDGHGFVRTGHDVVRAAEAAGEAGADLAGAQTGWRRSVLETSRPGIFALATSAVARPSGSLRPSARARWPSGSPTSGCGPGKRRGMEAAMPVMGFTKFERFFRVAGDVSVDRDDVQRYLDFVNDAIYDLLIIGQATAKAMSGTSSTPGTCRSPRGCRRASTRSAASMRRSNCGPSWRPWPPARRSTSRWTMRHRPGFRRFSAASASRWPGRSSSLTPKSRRCTPRSGNAPSTCSGC